MIGYKAFNSDWTCRDFQYKVGETYTLDGELSICKNGFHFCERLIDCYSFYWFGNFPYIAEVEALGDIRKGENKNCTNKIKIIREISIDEQLKIMGIDKEIYDIFIKTFNNFRVARLDGHWYDGTVDGSFCWCLLNGLSGLDDRGRAVGCQLAKDKIKLVYWDGSWRGFILTKDRQQNKIELNRMKDLIEDKDLKSIVVKIIEEI
jgi:hypothetical protein